MNPTSHKSLHLPTWPLTIISQPESVQSSLVQIRLEHTLSIALLDIVDTTTPRERKLDLSPFLFGCATSTFSNPTLSRVNQCSF